MDDKNDTPEQDDLWDPDLHRRTVLAMTRSERLELLDALCRQLTTDPPIAAPPR